jgi:multidrug efflux pump
MRFTEFFIRKPIFAIVINTMMIIIGLIAFNDMEVREYPKVDLPSFTIGAFYPNASAETTENSITNVLEAALAEVEGLDTISSQTSSGYVNIFMRMKAGTNTDKSMSLIRDAISKIRARFPKEVNEPTIERNIGNSSQLPFIAISFSSNDMDIPALSHYVNLHVKNRIRSIKGVGTLQAWNQLYRLEVLLDPRKMYALGINSSDVVKSFEENQYSLPAGKFQDRIEINLDMKPKNIDDYAELKIKQINNQPIYLKDVAKLQMKGDNEEFRIKINGQNGIILAVSKTFEANALTLSKDIREELTKINNNLPEGMKAWVALDQSDFIRASISNIKSSIIESILFVMLIIFIFLRNVRSALIPLLTIPISIIASVAILKAFGFSINTITMLAMVLAIGLVVDDAIVVLENIYRHIEKGTTPLLAAIKGSSEIGFAIVAMTFTLASVYIPIMFINDAIGQIFIEFALALSASVIISGFVALTLTPMMCSKLITKQQHNYFEKFDVAFVRLKSSYKIIMKKIIHKKIWILGSFLVIGLMISVLYLRLPQEIAPKEDRGIVGIYIPPLPGKTLDDVELITAKVADIVKSVPQAQDFYSFMGRWGAEFIIPLKEWGLRDKSSEQIRKELEELVKPLKTIDMHVWSINSGLPSIDSGDRMDSGIALQTTDDYDALYEIGKKFAKTLESQKSIKEPHLSLQIDTPQLQMQVNTRNLSHTQTTAYDIALTLETFFGGIKRFYFNLDSIEYPIIIKGMDKPWSISELYITNADKQRISLSSLVDVEYKLKPRNLEHLNQLRSAVVSFHPQEGESLSTIIKQINQLKKLELPDNIHTTWTGIYKVYLESSSTMYWLILMSLIFIYAILAMQFESFLDPFIIILTVPLACFGAIFGLWVSGGTMNIFTQIGIITLVGLITKHGILIVEFANQLVKEGMPISEAVIEAASLRLRPIIMTSATMIMGAIPLIISTDAGYESRHEIGLVLIWGLLVGSMLTVILIPSVYMLLKTKKSFLLNIRS